MTDHAADRKEGKLLKKLIFTSIGAESTKGYRLRISTVTFCLDL